MQIYLRRLRQGFIGIAKIIMTQKGEKGRFWREISGPKARLDAYPSTCLTSGNASFVVRFRKPLTKSVFFVIIFVEVFVLLSLPSLASCGVLAVRLHGGTDVTKEELKKDWEKRSTFYQPRTKEQRLSHKRVGNLVKNLGEELIDICPPSRELSTALTCLAETRMHANASLAIHINSQKEEG